MFSSSLPAMPPFAGYSPCGVVRGNLQWKGGDNMTKLELLTVLYALDSHLDKDDIVTARGVVKRIIAEAEKRP